MGVILRVFPTEGGSDDLRSIAAVTVDGRFDLLLPHVILVMRKLGDAAEAKQKLFDLLFADMDRSLREMGVGDMGVHRRMKAMIEAFYGRAGAYDRVFGGDVDSLPETLRRNLYGSVQVTAEKPASPNRVCAKHCRAKASFMNS